MSIFSADAKPFFAPSNWSIEDRTCKEEDCFAVFAKTKRSRPLSTRTTTAFNRTASTPGLALPSRPSLSRTFSIHADHCTKSVQETENELIESIDNCVTYAVGKLEFRDRNLKNIPSSIGDLKNMVSLDRFNSSTRSAPSLFSDCSNSSSSVPLQLFLQDNLLSHLSFPSVFFDLDNLTVLSLSGNPIKQLPPLICKLKSLKELNLCHTQLEYLPAEIQQLSLTTLLLNSNPWRAPEHGQVTQHSISKRMLEPLIAHFKIPSLVEQCSRLFVASSDDLSNLPVHLRHFLQPAFLQQAKDQICVCATRSSSIKVFLSPACSRFEHSERVAGVNFGGTPIPMLWRGCSRDCLEFLEEAE